MTIMERSFDQVLNQEQRAWNQNALRLGAALVVVPRCAYYVGLSDGERLAEGVPSLFSLLGEMFPPDFSDARTGVKPLIDTLAMSGGGTALAVGLSLPPA